MKIITSGIFIFAVALATSQLLQAQGTMTYLSSLSQTPTSTLPVASDYWLAALFFTGTNSSGYMLDSIQLGMADASGNPTNFTAMIYSAFIGGAVLPENSLGTLSDSLDPSTAGTYTFTSVSNLLLSPSTFYFIVLTAGTAVANDAYSWSESAFPPNSSGAWSAGNAVIHSGDGISGWSSDPSPYAYSGIGQFAINATAIPEPDVLGLFGLGSLAIIWYRRK
jgi:hypothetical protein